MIPRPVSQLVFLDFEVESLMGSSKREISYCIFDTLPSLIPRCFGGVVYFPIRLQD